MNEPELSIIIPAFNEEGRLPETLPRLARFCNALRFGWEVLLVVEKGADRTEEIARAAAAGLPSFHVLETGVHRGKGYAVRRGMLAARGAVRLFMDADLSVPPATVQTFLDYLAQNPGVDVLIGSRKHPQSRIVRRQSPLRERMGEGFNHLLRLVAGVPWRDTQCGFKAFRRSAAEALFARQRSDGFAFDVELLLLARKLGYTVEEHPVEWTNSPESHVHILRDSVRMAADVLRIRCRVGR